MDIYKSAFESSPDLVVCVDPEGNIVEVNRKCGEALGYERDELIGRSVDMLVPERFRPMHAAYRAGYQADPKVRTMGSGRTLFVKRKDGTEIPVDVMLSNAQTSTGSFVIAVLRDIAAIRESERRAEGMLSRLRLSAEAAGMGYWTYEEATGRLWCDENFAALFGGSPGDFPDGDSVRKRIVPEDRAVRSRKAWESLEASGKYESEFRVIHPDGTIHWLADMGRHVSGTGSRDRIFTGVTFDISGRKSAEARAEEARRRERELMELAPDGIFLADYDGKYLDVNSSGCRLLGYSREELMGKTILDLIPPEDASRLMAAKESLATGESHVAEWKLRRKDGSWVEVEVNAKIYPDGRWQGFVRDITDRKKSERKQIELVAKLQKTLGEIKVLRGLLPICAHCKRIRNESGTWEAVESYVHKRTEAQFSHGICPDCIRKHYADYFPVKGNDGPPR